MARGNERNKVVTPAACLCSPRAARFNCAHFSLSTFPILTLDPSPLATLQFSPEGFERCRSDRSQPNYRAGCAKTLDPLESLSWHDPSDRDLSALKSIIERKIKKSRIAAKARHNSQIDREVRAFEGSNTTDKECCPPVIVKNNPVCIVVPAHDSSKVIDTVRNCVYSAGIQLQRPEASIAVSLETLRICIGVQSFAMPASSVIGRLRYIRTTRLLGEGILTDRICTCAGAATYILEITAAALAF